MAGGYRANSPNNQKERVVMHALIYRLSLAHRRLEKEISREMQKAVPDDARLSRLKKLRLAIKDQLQGFLPQPSTHRDRSMNGAI